MSHKSLTDKQLQEAGRMYTMGGGTYGAAERVIAHVAELAFENGLAQSGLRTLALWLPIETAPRSGNALLLGYENSRGKWLTFRGKWISKEEIENEWDQPEDFDAGWYEESVEADDVPNCWPVSPTHWMPLPAAPSPAAQSEGQEAILPVWWPDFIQNVCELPDRSSPENEPEAMVATAEELENCAMRAIEDAAPVNGGARANSVVMSGWQLLEALDMLAPDRDTDREQMEDELLLMVGEGHSGHGVYGVYYDMPEEGATLIDGKTAENEWRAAEVQQADGGAR
ncbi:DUF551 domain-containing protein [Pandoraea sputorum]|uniref:DUF551 domain-containing protein n=1 Tax=Pandoraea sputorum TaxID=93222 RepID=UPI002F9178B0